MTTKAYHYWNTGSEEYKGIQHKKDDETFYTCHIYQEVKIPKFPRETKEEVQTEMDRLHYHYWNRITKDYEGVTLTVPEGLNHKHYVYELFTPTECPKVERKDGWYLVGASECVASLRLKHENKCYGINKTENLSYIGLWNDSNYLYIKDAKSILKTFSVWSNQ